MADMREFESRIRMELANEANKMTRPEDLLFDRILAGIPGAEKKSRTAGICRWYVVAVLVALLYMGTTLLFSTGARAVATEAVQAIKTVFMVNKGVEIVQKPASTALCEPVNAITTNLSDADLSKKMGMKVYFPKTLAADAVDLFVLQHKADGVKLTKPLDYANYQNISSQITAAITDQQAFDSLRQYQPCRTAGGVYEDQQGRKAGVSVYNKLIPLYMSEGNEVTDTTRTKVAAYEAKWIGLSYPDYPEGDLAQKPAGRETAHILLWSSGKTTYKVLAISPLSMEETVGLAQSFMQAQVSFEITTMRNVENAGTVLYVSFYL
jgi:hypothetical protein